MSAVLVCVLSLAFVYRVQLLSHGDTLPGDVLDARIALAIEQHWFNVFRGFEGWNQPLYFVPTRDVLGYNDGYFLFGVVSSGFRLLGLDVFLAGEAAGAVFRAAGFASMTVLGWRFLRLPYPAALLAAVLATVSDALYIQSAHVQLLSLGLAPLLAVLVWQAARDLGRAWRCIVWSCLAAALFDAWLLTAFYTAWFTALFALLSAVAAGPVRVAGFVRRLPVARLAPAAAVLVAGAVPFVIVYAPKAGETGMHPFAEVLAYTPSVLDLVHVGSGNLLFGGFDRWLTARMRPGFLGLGEHTVGMPPPLLGLALAGAVTAIVRRASWRPFAVAFLLSLVLCLHAGRFSPWWLVYEAVPGAGAVRVVSRFVLFLQPVAALFAAWWLAGVARAGWRGPAVALAVLLMAAEATADGEFGLNRPAERRLVAAVPRPPAECRAFYVEVPRLRPAGGVEDLPLLVNVDGMFLAEVLHLPTFNGHASFLPAGFMFGFNDLASYGAAVRTSLQSADAQEGGAEGVCGLDLVQDRWVAPSIPVATVSMGEEVLFGAGGGGAGLLLRGWSGQESAGRWSVGHDARLLMRVVAPPGGLTLTLDVQAFSGRGGPGTIGVFANGVAVATWQPSGAPERLAAFIPAGLIAADGVLQLRLAVARPMRPVDAGQGNDPRLLGLFVEGLRLSPGRT